jgi:hypothetical protein
MTERTAYRAQHIREQIMARQNVVPDSFEAYNDRQLEIAKLQHQLGCILADPRP